MLDLSKYDDAAVKTNGHGIEIRADGSFAITLTFVNPTDDPGSTLRLLRDAPLLLAELKEAHAALDQFESEVETAWKDKEIFGYGFAVGHLYGTCLRYIADARKAAGVKDNG